MPPIARCLPLGGRRVTASRWPASQASSTARAGATAVSSGPLRTCRATSRRAAQRATASLDGAGSNAPVDTARRHAGARRRWIRFCPGSVSLQRALLGGGSLLDPRGFPVRHAPPAAAHDRRLPQRVAPEGASGDEIAHAPAVRCARPTTMSRPTPSAAPHPARSLPVIDDTAVPMRNPRRSRREATHVFTLTRAGPASTGAMRTCDRSALDSSSTGIGLQGRRRRAPARRDCRNRRRSDADSSGTAFGRTYPPGYPTDEASAPGNRVPASGGP